MNFDTLLKLASVFEKAAQLTDAQKTEQMRRWQRQLRSHRPALSDQSFTRKPSLHQTKAPPGKKVDLYAFMNTLNPDAAKGQMQKIQIGMRDVDVDFTWLTNNISTKFDQLLQVAESIPEQSRRAVDVTSKEMQQIGTIRTDINRLLSTLNSQLNALKNTKFAERAGTYKEIVEDLTGRIEADPAASEYRRRDIPPTEAPIEQRRAPGSEEYKDMFSTPPPKQAPAPRPQKPKEPIST